MSVNMVQIEIEVLGRRYTVGCPDNEKDALLDAVRYLEQKMHMIREAGRVIDVDKIAVMAALNIANEYLRTQVSENLDIAAVRHKIESMNETIDQAMLQQNRLL